MSRLLVPGRFLFGQSFLAADVTTPVATGAITTLLSITGTTRGNSTLNIQADFSGSNALAVGGLYFFLNLDGVRVPQSGCGESGSLGAMAGAINKRVAVAAGAHTVILQFRTDAVLLSQGRVRPIAVPDAEHAGLIIWEEFN